ncbi:hypothetical protein QLQ80_03200 [Mycoplasma sp. M5725]|uniref:Uncharacterized protein n=1 Tax=Mycoplasma phocimorsus TaxID=3045839 RepID=A0AAJ1PUH4_9MOLU|nr:hypothetical protein [Mycoplasma phocimorsus]MDJ1646070.1 hypothetical protein [Mycoplasma phocimorsus]
MKKKTKLAGVLTGIGALDIITLSSSYSFIQTTETNKEVKLKIDNL